MWDGWCCQVGRINEMARVSVYVVLFGMKQMAEGTDSVGRSMVEKYDGGFNVLERRW